MVRNTVVFSVSIPDVLAEKINEKVEVLKALGVRVDRSSYFADLASADLNKSQTHQPSISA